MPNSPQKPAPLARSKNDDPTFGRPDAYALVKRLASTWNYLAEEGRAETLVKEFVAQFDGYDPALVDDAATRAIGKSGKNFPTAGEIKAELRGIVSLASGPQQAATAYGYRPWHNYDQIPDEVQSGPDSILGNARRLMRQGCAPEYILFREKERALMRETVARMNAMSTEHYNKLYGGFADKFKTLPPKAAIEAPEDGSSDVSPALRDMMQKRAA